MTQEEKQQIVGFIEEWTSPEHGYFADRIIEFVESLYKEPASEDLEQEIDNYFFNYKDPDTGKPLVKEECWLDNEQVHKFAQHIAQWQKEQMLNDAIETTIDGKVVKVIVIDE